MLRYAAVARLRFTFAFVDKKHVALHNYQVAQVLRVPVQVPVQHACIRAAAKARFGAITARR